MALTTAFPAEFTLMGIVEISSTSFLTLSNDALQAFIETGSSETFVLASLLDASDLSLIKLVTARSSGDSSGDSGILITIHLTNTTAPNPPINCVVAVLQKGATRYQDPRRF